MYTDQKFSADETLSLRSSAMSEGTQTTEARAGLLNVEEAAKYLGMSTHWVYKASADGRLPTTKCGRYSKFRKADLEAWLKKNTKNADPEE